MARAELARGQHHLRRVDPVIGELIDRRPDYDSRAWLDDLPGQDEVVEIAEKWRPFRSLATSYLLASAFDAEPELTAATP